MQPDPHAQLIDRLVALRRELVDRLAGLDHLDGGLVGLLAQVQVAIEAVAAAGPLSTMVIGSAAGINPHDVA